MSDNNLTQAPATRTVDQFSGRRPSKLFEAFEEADRYCAEMQRLREENDQLRCRVDEQDEELADMRELLRGRVNEVAQLRNERDTLTIQASQ